MSQRLELHSEVPGELHGERLDQAAARLFPDYSRSRLQAWIKSGELKVDSQQRRPRDKVRRGAVLSIDAELVQEVGWKPQDIELDILHEDDSILVINKKSSTPRAAHLSFFRGTALSESV